MRIRTLRGRLVAAMLLILVLAIAFSSLLDSVKSGRPEPPADEPYQDALVLAGFSVPALLLIWLISSWSLRPLDRISQQARRIGPGNAASRLSPAGLPAEIVPLVEAVNGALDRMVAAFAAERQFTENAAHELRTPLAVLALRLQRARHAATGENRIDWAAIDGDLEQLNKLVSQMLDLARKENEARAAHDVGRPEVNLSRVVREACAAMLPAVESQGRTLSLKLPEVLHIRGDADALGDALRNLLENALLHGSGTISVHGRMEGEQGRILLCVSDEGQGFNPADVEAAFERFHKGSHSKGTGLGLAIVREVLRSHGGNVTAHPGPSGRIELSLPIYA